MAKFTPIKRNCLNCNKLFKAVRKWHNFCQSKCRVEYWRKLHPHLDPEELRQIKEKLGIQE